MTGHWRSENDGQLCDGHVVKTSTRHGLEAGTQVAAMTGSSRPKAVVQTSEMAALKPTLVYKNQLGTLQTAMSRLLPATNIRFLEIHRFSR